MNKRTFTHYGKEHVLSWDQEPYSDQFIAAATRYTGRLDGKEMPGYFFTFDSMVLNARRILDDREREDIEDSVPLDLAARGKA